MTVVPDPVVVSPVTPDGPTVGAPVEVTAAVTAAVVVPDDGVATGQPAHLTGGLNGAALWEGEGPPGPENLIIGARVGDEYLDKLTGTVYRLDEG